MNGSVVSVSVSVSRLTLRSMMASGSGLKWCWWMRSEWCNRWLYWRVIDGCERGCDAAQNDTSNVTPTVPDKVAARVSGACIYGPAGEGEPCVCRRCCRGPMDVKQLVWDHAMDGAAMSADIQTEMRTRVFSSSCPKHYRRKISRHENKLTHNPDVKWKPLVEICSTLVDIIQMYLPDKFCRSVDSTQCSQNSIAYQNIEKLCFLKFSRCLYHPNEFYKPNKVTYKKSLWHF